MTVEELTDEEKETYAEMYIDDIETKWLQGKPYRSTLFLAVDIRNTVKCGLKDAINICKIIGTKDRKRLEGTLYEVSNLGGFYLPAEAFAEATNSGIK